MSDVTYHDFIDEQGRRIVGVSTPCQLLDLASVEAANVETSPYTKLFLEEGVEIFRSRKG